MTLGGFARLMLVVYLLAFALAAFLGPGPAQAAGASAFEGFVEALRPDAAARGVSARVFDQAFAGVKPDPALPARLHKQGEFTLTAGAYLTRAVSAAKVAQARREARRWADTLGEVERAYGVDRRIVLGVWGMESNFGADTGGRDVVASLATFAAAGERGGYFRDELLDALVILQQGHVAPGQMTGSWAGAMGQTQFMPSAFLTEAVDFDGDGKKDIWRSVPDALASTAKFLRDHGWEPGLDWGAEVVLPQGFVLKASDHADDRPFAEWAARGVRGVDGAPLPARGSAHLTLPMGRKGPAFLRTPNFEAIRAYNTSTSYALAVATLGERAAGRPASPLVWPKESALSARAALALQRALAAQGYAVAKFDGKIGDKDRAVIALWQERHGLDPDGHPSPALVKRILSAGR